jgi:hypothetical protein
MCPGAAGFAPWLFAFLRPLATYDEASPRPTEDEDTQGPPFCAGALWASWALTGGLSRSGALTRAGFRFAALTRHAGRVGSRRVVGQGEAYPGLPGRLHPGIKPGQRTSALVMVTSCFGTSWWPPALPVGTAAMASTVSVPSTTLPNTA